MSCTHCCVGHHELSSKPRLQHVAFKQELKLLEKRSYKNKTPQATLTLCVQGSRSTIIWLDMPWKVRSKEGWYLKSFTLLALWWGFKISAVSIENLHMENMAQTGAEKVCSWCVISLTIASGCNKTAFRVFHNSTMQQMCTPVSTTYQCRQDSCRGRFWSRGTHGYDAPGEQKSDESVEVSHSLTGRHLLHIKTIYSKMSVHPDTQWISKEDISVFFRVEKHHVMCIRFFCSCSYRYYFKYMPSIKTRL